MKPAIVADEMFPEGAGPYMDIEEILMIYLMMKICLSIRCKQCYKFGSNDVMPYKTHMFKPDMSVIYVMYINNSGYHGYKTNDNEVDKCTTDVLQSCI
ncbi:hypothetical protein KUTeg_012318 [Tegillarca granosa]|uniref:Uncharacterized protein n=1 Tax=Tegillarca granosa TaxID=220873 RepID=A0ABQ9F4C5_TEGGR|nr:hypothetical protein KUTeg_012318 [Tegillarca granosa]